MQRKINLAIICGGISSEREVSFNSGRLIARMLPDDKFNISFIEITAGNKWIIGDKRLLIDKKADGNKLGEKYLLKQDELVKKVDVVFIALHGKYGEDGKIQAILDLMKMPYTGSGVLASALGMNKFKCIQFIKKYGIKTPKSIVINNDYDLNKIKALLKSKIAYPCIVKPNESGSSIGISLVKNQSQLKTAIDQALRECHLVLLEEYIQGREFACGTLGNTGQTKFISLPPVEIIIKGSEFFDYEAKYSNSKTMEVCPADISGSLSREIQKKSRKIHELLGCDGLTRVDFILSKKDNRLYFLEINTIPGQTEVSLCPKEAKAMGMTLQEFMEKQIELALQKYEN